MNRIIYSALISWSLFTTLESIAFKFINKTKEHFYLSTPNVPNKFIDNLYPGTSAEWNITIKDPIIKGSLLPHGEKFDLPVNKFMQNPYPDGVSEIEISKGLIKGFNYKVHFLDSKRNIKITPSHISDINKVLGLPKNAAPEEILYRAGELAGFKFSENKVFKLTGSISGMSKAEFHELYSTLKKKWGSNQKVWENLEKSIKEAYKG